MEHTYYKEWLNAQNMLENVKDSCDKKILELNAEIKQLNIQIDKLNAELTKFQSKSNQIDEDDGNSHDNFFGYNIKRILNFFKHSNL